MLYDPQQENPLDLIIPVSEAIKFSAINTLDMDDQEIKAYSFVSKGDIYIFQFIHGKDEKADALEYLTTQLIFEAKNNKCFLTASKSDLRQLCK